MIDILLYLLLALAFFNLAIGLKIYVEQSATDKCCCESERGIIEKRLGQ